MILYTPPAKAATIPLIDVTGLSSDDFATRKAVAWEIHKACRETGFFYACNHGIPESVMAAQLGWTARFFGLPMADKLVLDFARSPRRLGYEKPMQQVLDEGSAPDFKESYMYAESLGVPAEVPNLWPRLDGFVEEMRAYHAAVGALGLRLMRGIALSLDVTEDFFEAPYHASQFAVRLLHYPPRTAPAERNQLGAGAHTDWGGITLLLQDECGGLEVRDIDGDWIAAPPVPGAFVINLGDLMRRWTNDLYSSTLHRVVSNAAGRDRYSVATFFGPRGDARIECIPSCAEGRPVLHPAITASEHTAEMARRTYATAA